MRIIIGIAVSVIATCHSAATNRLTHSHIYNTLFVVSIVLFFFIVTIAITMQHTVICELYNIMQIMYHVRCTYVIFSNREIVNRRFQYKFIVVVIREGRSVSRSETQTRSILLITAYYYPHKTVVGDLSFLQHTYFDHFQRK